MVASVEYNEKRSRRLNSTALKWIRLNQFHVRSSHTLCRHVFSSQCKVCEIHTLITVDSREVAERKERKYCFWHSFTYVIVRRLFGLVELSWVVVLSLLLLNSSTVVRLRVSRLPIHSLLLLFVIFRCYKAFASSSRLESTDAPK